MPVDAAVDDEAGADDGCIAAGPGDELRLERQLEGAGDFVEVDPSQDPTGLTIMNMANAFLAFASGLAGR